MSFCKKADGMDTFTDERDKEPYRVVRIGNQEWMAENLRYKCDGAVCGESDPKRYGLLYFLQDFADLAPAGWRVPSLKDWTELICNVGGARADNIADDVVYAIAGKVLKAECDWDFDDDFLCGYAPDEKADPFHFSALPTGFINNYELVEQWKATSFWVADETGLWVKRVVLYNFTNNAHIESRRDMESFACSIRCVRDVG